MRVRLSDSQQLPGPRLPLVLSCLAYTRLVLGAGRTLPAGEGGCAAGSLPPSHYLKLGSIALWRRNQKRRKALRKPHRRHRDGRILAGWR
jgi:hypothetical protein